MKLLRIVSLLTLALSLGMALNAGAEEKKKIVLVAGTPSHGPGEHEHNAGVLLLTKCLNQVGGIEAVAYTNGWPQAPDVFDGASAVVLYMDGGDRHLAIQGNHLVQLNEAMRRGAGLACLHYAVEVPAGKGGMEFLNWIGGYFETNWSVNPTWEADFKQLPEHPITRGVKPFKIYDEWYYHMRFQDDHVTPILSAVPPDSTREHPDDPHGGNHFVRERKGMAEDTAWAYERPDGGRGFGFTGSHFHKNWGNENFRRIVLNAILWIAKVEVPADGVQSTVTEDDLQQNLDPKGQRKIARKPAATTYADAAAKAKYKSGVVKWGGRAVDVDITGAKNLWLVVTDGGNGNGCDWADWLEPKLTRADGTTVKLTSLPWKSASSGWGNVNVGKDVEGGPLTANHQVIKDGIGTHAPSLIEYELPEGITRFQANAALDDGGTEQDCGSQVEFMVFTEKPADILLQVSTQNTQASNPGSR